MKYLFLLLLCGSHLLLRETSAADTSGSRYLWANETEIPADIVCDYTSVETGNRGTAFPENDPTDTLWGKDSLIFSSGSDAPTDSLPVTDSADAEREDTSFIVEDCMPEFPGGQQALREFFAMNLRYPEQARKDGIEGRVVAEVIIAQDGRPTEINIIQKVDPDLDKEVIRMLHSMPYWIPCKARQRGVRVRYVLPFNFRLSEDTTEDK
ncbi:MAG: energy transducer TonB [Bacteroides sp.]|nr:energy transducer TonB [Bacteroides sp.]